ncbi:MAG TPA: beta-propeller domain-containing protein, partial [Burkholderiaceae bacterium]|nr:beta-propeller domain-containing protein [Burkholderiaceae bacterium]
LQLGATAQRAVALSESLQPIGTPQPCPPEATCLAALIYPPFQLKSSVDLQFFSLDANGNAQLADKVSIDGRLVASRLVAHSLVLVTTHAPRLAYELLPADATPQQRVDELARLSADDVLPFWRPQTGSAQPLVAETDCYVQPANSSLVLEITTITVIDLASLTRQGRCFVGGTEAAYMSMKSVVLATTRWPYRILDSGRIVYQPQFVTDLHRFAFDGSGVDYRASGEVAGHLGWDPARKPYRISEHDNGDMRVLTYTGDTGWALPVDAESANAPPPSPATLTVLREVVDERALKTVATLPNSQRPAPLGKPGEQVFAVRFAGARAYLVTFRRVDPLFVLDLADASDPKVAGELTVPGFSDYLFPLPNGLLFGVGKDILASGQIGGVKLGLFDVSDAAHPQAIDSRTLGSSGSLSGLDFSSHGINLMHRGALTRIALPLRLTSAPWAANPAHGLQRIEVDTAARALAVRSMLGAPPSPFDDLWGDRSVQIADKLVFLSSGQLTVADW